MLKTLCFIALFVGLSIPALANTGRYSETVVSIANSVTYCESSNRQDGVWGKAGEYGKAQFKPQTFTWMKKVFHKPGYSIINEKDQVDLLREAIKHGYGNHWNTCYKKAVKQFAVNATLKRRELMMTGLLKPKTVDSIVASFSKVLIALEDHANNMYADVAKKETEIADLVAKKEVSMKEHLKAANLKKKFEEFLA